MAGQGIGKALLTFLPLPAIVFNSLTLKKGKKMGNRQNLNCIPHKILSSIPGAIMQATDKDTSFKLLKNYYTKEQKTVNLGKDFIKKSECIQDAVKSNFNHIINESITGKSENTKSALKKLIEGKIEETKIRDKFSFKQKSETKAEDIFSRGKDAEFALGRFILDSDFEGTASRYGDTITVQGILQNHIKDRYDFDKKNLYI